jgi:peroxiredoxin
MAPMESVEPLVPAQGWAVLHLFATLAPGWEPEAVMAAAKPGPDEQVIAFSVLGHKADLGLMLIGPDLVALRRRQSALQQAGAVLVDSFVSLTEVSEYAQGMPAARLEARLHPRLPPDGKRAICFYPMSKRRLHGDNWYRLEYEERLRLMYEHGTTGREFAGRVLQLVTGATGLDDFEWGVTLFAVNPDDLKDCVYRMRFDEASARYAEFGTFYAGTVAPLAEVLALCPGAP